MYIPAIKMPMKIAVVLAAILMLGAVTVLAHSEQADENIIVARNYVTVELSDTGVVMGGKKGRFEPAEFKGVEGTALLMFMYNRISRDKCVHLISRLYEKDQAEVGLRVDHVLAFLKDKNLLLTSKYPNPSRNFGMNKFKLEE